MWQSVEILNVFNTLTLKKIFCKKKTFFKKLEYRFLVQSTKIKNAPFPYTTTISESNVKTNRMVITKWTYHKEWSFASSYFILLKILFPFKKLLKRVDLMYWSFIWGCFFPVSIIKYLSQNCLIYRISPKTYTNDHRCYWFGCDSHAIIQNKQNSWEILSTIHSDKESSFPS